MEPTYDGYEGPSIGQVTLLRVLARYRRDLLGGGIVTDTKGMHAVAALDDWGWTAIHKRPDGLWCVRLTRLGERELAQWMRARASG